MFVSRSAINSFRHRPIRPKIDMKSTLILILLLGAASFAKGNSGGHELTEEELAKKNTLPGRIDEHPPHHDSHDPESPTNNAKEALRGHKSGHGMDGMDGYTLMELLRKIDALEYEQKVCMGLTSTALALLLVAVLIRVLKAVRRSKFISSDEERHMCRPGRCLNNIGLMGSEEACMDCRPAVMKVKQGCQKCQAKVKKVKEDAEDVIESKIDYYIQKSLERMSQTTDKGK